MQWYASLVLSTKAIKNKLRNKGSAVRSTHDTEDWKALFPTICLLIPKNSSGNKATFSSEPDCIRSMHKGSNGHQRIKAPCNGMLLWCNSSKAIKNKLSSKRSAVQSTHDTKNWKALFPTICLLIPKNSSGNKATLPSEPDCIWNMHKGSNGHRRIKLHAMVCFFGSFLLTREEMNWGSIHLKL